QPYGAGQQRHTDYPLHVGSGAFWENSIEKVEALTTRYQIDKIFPFISLQTLIASDEMDEENGSTEILPHSHHISMLDLKLHDPLFKEIMKDEFINVKLAQGDVLVFNRGLYHAGGTNKTNKRRNSAIMQNVMLFAIGQHKHDIELIFNNLEQAGVFDSMSNQEVKNFKLRIEKPYPLDTTKIN
ncbi:MAG: phytanoyl-CoA dioxygenase family protein, partial [bacterium]|nr:phytanoyl-CoA dioxygenase family protein [bacterium]